MIKKLPLILSIVSISTASALVTVVSLSAAGTINLLAEDKVTCTFRNYDDSFLWSTQIYKGANVTYEGVTPTRPNEGENKYTFSSWDKTLNNISEDTIFYPYYFSTLIDLKVEFVNFDSSLLYSDNVEFGGDAVYQGKRPSRPSDDEYAYTFTGWDKPLTNIQEDTTITAVYDKSKIDYTVTFCNYDGTVLFILPIAYGGDAYYSGPTPVKQSTTQYDYVFIGWDKTLENVTQNMTTTAQFKEEKVQFVVEFCNYDGTLLYTDYVSYGGTADYFGPTPYHPNDGERRYVFYGWNKDLSPIYSNLTVVARFTGTVLDYVVTFMYQDGVVLFQCSVNYGEKAVYNGATPTKADDEKYTYTFSGWDRDISFIKEDLYVCPTFTRELRTFIVTFCNYDYSYLSSTNVQYGDTAFYSGSTPTRQATDDSYYKFIGWDKDLQFVTNDFTTLAVFEKVGITTSDGGGGGGDGGGGGGGGGASSEESSEEKYYVFFFGWNSDPSSISNAYAGTIVNAGDTAIYYGSLSSINRSNYTFVGWDKDLTNVQHSFYTYAQYKTNTGKFIVTFRNSNGVLLYECQVYSGQSAYYGGILYDYLKQDNGFTGWSKSLSNITSSITVYPTYEGGN